MKIKREQIIKKVTIFPALNGRDMEIADYIKNTSKEEMACILSKLFCDGENEKEVLRILQRPAIDLLNVYEV